MEESDDLETSSIDETIVANVLASDERLEESAPDEENGAGPSKVRELEVEEMGVGTSDD